MGMLNSVLRRCNEGMMSFFEDIVVVDHKGQSHDVPILYGTVEQAKDWAFALADQFLDKALTKADYFKMFNVLQRFPVLNLELINSDFEAEQPKLTYRLHALSTLREEMDQMVEQVVLKFDNRKHYKLESISSGEDIVNHSCRLKKWEFIVTLEGLGATETD